jgi:prophage maintenance system killer protein
MSFTDELENNIRAVYYAVLNKKYTGKIKGKTLNCDSYRKIVEELKSVIGNGLSSGADVLEITNNIIFSIINKNYFIYENLEMAALIGYIYLKRQGVIINNYSMNGIDNNSTLDDIKKITALW